MNTQQTWKVIANQGRFVVLDSNGKPVTSHSDLDKAIEHAHSIASTRQLNIQIVGSFTVQI